ncbi:MAG: phage tail tape measure protein, partial [Smithellaceae bacterium]
MALDAGAVVGRLEMALAGWKQSVETVKADQQSMARFAIRHSDEIKKLGKAFTIAGGVMTAALGAIVAKTANAGDEIAKLSQRTGVSTELLSGYSLAAKLADVSLEGLGGGLKLLSRNMNEASQGTGTAKDAFKELGIEVVNADGTLRDSNEVLLDVADRFSGTENGAKKTALAMDIFGRSGADLIPMLNLGRKGLEENYEQARRLGLVYSKESAQGCEAFNDSITTLKAGLQGTGREIGGVLMPIIQGFVEKATETVIKIREWAAEHPGLTKVITLLAAGLGAVMVTLGPMLIILPKLVAGWTAFAAVLHTSTAALAASLAGLTALAAGAVMVYKTINTMIKAKEASVEADYEMSASNTEVGKKLREMADAAGVSRAELIKLTEKYGDNNVALQQAINSGKDQDETLQKLHAVVVKHREEVKKQEEALQKLTDLANNKTNPTLTTLGEKTKEVTEAVKTQFTAIVNTADGWSTLEQQMLDMAREV